MATADPALPAADLLPVGPKANIAYRIVRLFAVPIMQLAFRIEVHGAENIPKKGGPNYIVIANHLNWPDEFLLLLLFPIEPRLHFLADPTLLVTRKFQWFVVRHSGGYVPVVRSRHGDRRRYRDLPRRPVRAGRRRARSVPQGLRPLRDQGRRAGRTGRAFGHQGRVVPQDPEGVRGGADPGC